MPTLKRRPNSPAELLDAAKDATREARRRESLRQFNDAVERMRRYADDVWRPGRLAKSPFITVQPVNIVGRLFPMRKIQIYNPYNNQ